jgi:hypothetical protein
VEFGNKERHGIHLAKLKILGKERYERLLNTLKKGGK